MPQVQILVEKDKNVNFKRVLELAASVQPTKVEANTVEDVRIN
jgi:glycyl-tRNA synthetase